MTHIRAFVLKSMVADYMAHIIAYIMNRMIALYTGLSSFQTFYTGYLVVCIRAHNTVFNMPLSVPVILAKSMPSIHGYNSCYIDVYIHAYKTCHIDACIHAI